MIKSKGCRLDFDDSRNYQNEMKNIPNEDNFMENSNHKIDDEKSKCNNNNIIIIIKISNEYELRFLFFKYLRRWVYMHADISRS